MMMACYYCSIGSIVCCSPFDETSHLCVLFLWPFWLCCSVEYTTCCSVVYIDLEICWSTLFLLHSSCVTCTWNSLSLFAVSLISSCCLIDTLYFTDTLFVWYCYIWLFVDTFTLHSFDCCSLVPSVIILYIAVFCSVMLFHSTFSIVVVFVHCYSFVVACSCIRSVTAFPADIHSSHLLHCCCYSPSRHSINYSFYICNFIHWCATIVFIRDTVYILLLHSTTFFFVVVCYSFSTVACYILYAFGDFTCILYYIVQEAVMQCWWSPRLPFPLFCPALFVLFSFSVLCDAECSVEVCTFDTIHGDCCCMVFPFVHSDIVSLILHWSVLICTVYIHTYITFYVLSLSFFWCYRCHCLSLWCCLMCIVYFICSLLFCCHLMCCEDGNFIVWLFFLLGILHLQYCLMYLFCCYSFVVFVLLLHFHFILPLTTVTLQCLCYPVSLQSASHSFPCDSVTFYLRWNSWRLTLPTFADHDILLPHLHWSPFTFH